MYCCGGRVLPRLLAVGEIFAKPFTAPIVFERERHDTGHGAGCSLPRHSARCYLVASHVRTLGELIAETKGGPALTLLLTETRTWARARALAVRLR